MSYPFAIDDKINAAVSDLVKNWQFHALESEVSSAKHRISELESHNRSLESSLLELRQFVHYMDERLIAVERAAEELPR